MENTLEEFRKRQTAVAQKHSRMARGYVTKLDKETGVYVQQPDSKAGSYSLKAFIFFGLAFMFLKALMLAWLGPDVYQATLVELHTGSAYEQAGAWIMRPEPVTETIAGVLAFVIK